LRPVKLIVPEGSILNPRWPCPVASGNVETSQRVVDLLLGCLGISAGSQGTMNNLLFQVQGEVPYYETIGGGYGGSVYCMGPSAVQVHMTNTRITDPEVLELRHPGIRLRRFSVRHGSGGKGRHPGGDGIIRDIEFLKEATVTVVSERRKTPAFGLNGGTPGARGVNLLWPQGQRPQEIPHRASFKVSPGTRLIIKTPGGGGFNQ
ncbi:MAG: 5-oxoprolinase, partial [Nitrospirae bacterium]